MYKKKQIMVFFAILLCVALGAAMLAGCTKKADYGTRDEGSEDDNSSAAVNNSDNTDSDGAENVTVKEDITLGAASGVEIIHEGFGDNKSYVVVIDAGHQSQGMKEQEPLGPGSDTMKDKVTSGTKGSFTDIPEYELTLTVALALRDELLSRGYTVVMVRETHDVKVSNIERAEIANKYAPTNENGYAAAINIRIHANGFTDPAANGALMCCPTKDNPYKIGELFEECERLANAIIDPYCNETGMRKRPTHIQYGDNMTGTNWCEIPTTILEMGFMTNESDDMLMQESDFRYNAAKGIADGIDNYFDRAK